MQKQAVLPLSVLYLTQLPLSAVQLKCANSFIETIVKFYLGHKDKWALKACGSAEKGCFVL